jgi:hypothetical protein
MAARLTNSAFQAMKTIFCIYTPSVNDTGLHTSVGAIDKSLVNLAECLSFRVCERFSCTDQIKQIAG